MKCGILITGSLLWDNETDGRAAWRNKRLDIDGRVPVKAPIYYGRRSEKRRNTYTMTFRPEGPSGVATLVPCQLQIETIDDIKIEACALWKAEAPKSSPGALGSEWGCVGVLFGNDEARESLAAKWSAHFLQVRTEGLSVVKPDGHLDIAWPNNTNGAPADIDIILATATLPEVRPPAVGAVADAWIGQDGGYERYFFENVRYGVRTPDDLEIWSRIESAAPRWLSTDTYSEAVAKLRSEAQTTEAV